MDKLPTYFTDKHAISMTLRDYFAAKAMQSFVMEGGIEEANYSFEIIAKVAYEMADEMLKERALQKGDNP